MRSALALSAPLLLLLLLLLPPPSLSQNETLQATAQSTTAQSTTTQSTTTQNTRTTTQMITTQTTAKTTGSQSTILNTTTSMTTTQKTSVATAKPTEVQSTGTPTTTTQTTTAKPTEVQPTGTQTTQASPTPSLSTKVPSKPSRSSTTPNTTATPPPATTPSSTPQPALSPVPSKPPGSTPEGPKGMPTASCGSGSMADRTFPSSQGPPPTRAPLSTPQGSQQTSSKMPAVAGTTASGPAATTPVIRPGIKVDCQPPETLTKTMLILNVTETMSQVLCESKSPPLGDKLATLLCRAAKSTFDPNQDQCHIQLVPGVPGIHALAIQEISIQTNLLPSDVYKLLKDKWDEATAVGVSGMQFGDQGPPEETEDRFSMPLIITIVCMASFLLLVAALYGCCHQRLSQRKDQQRLTEELQTVENGYHDNPTLEVMETSSDMQEKKVVNLNGELGDSWIVPLDNLTKDDLDEEEDTHL